MKKISLFFAIFFIKTVAFSQITGVPSTWAMAYCNQEYGLNYKAVSVPLHQRNSNLVGTGIAQPASMAISGIGSNVVIRKALLWFTIVGQNAPTTNYPSLTLKNPSGTTLSLTNITNVSSLANNATGWQGSPNTNFASGNTYNYRAEVTLVGNVYNGNYSISGLPTTLSTNPDIDVTGAMLMIIYKDNNDCGLGSLYIQDAIVMEGYSMAGSYNTTTPNICFPIPTNTSSQYTHFLNVVDLEMNGNGEFYLGPGAAGGHVMFTSDMYNFISATSNFVEGSNTIPTSWIIQSPTDYGSYTGGNKSFSNVRGFYWKDNIINGAMTASFTVPYYTCQGSAVTMNGTASTGAIEQHMWTIIETNSNGTPLSTATEWLGNWIPGAPTANETFPTPANGGPILKCGKFYKIKLALNNDCQVWVETTRNIAIACNPVLDFRNSTSSICGSKSIPGTGYLSLGGLSGSYNLKWYVNNPNQTQSLIYNGGLVDIIVHPTLTTTYTCVLTDLTTGCSSNGNFTVTVYPAMNAAFSHSVNPINSTCYTISATPTVTTAASTPGFTQIWKVEEFLTNGTILFTLYNSNWQMLPLTSATTFCGFDDVANNYTGTSTITGTIPSAGKFLYGHKYRITRTVSANNCPSDNFVLELNQVYKMAQEPIIGSNSINLTDFESMISIYPNPSNGIFTISIPITDNSKVQIFDVLGNEVESFSTESDVEIYDIDLSANARGIYTVQIVSGNEIITKKIVKE